MRDHQREHAAHFLTGSTVEFRANAPRGLADLLARELSDFGGSEVREHAGGVSFAGTLETAYRACLWSRVANRVFLPIARFPAADAAAYYEALVAIDWSAHLAPGATLACDFTGRHPTLTHTHFGALKLKDAIVDSLRARTGARPDVQLEHPSVRVHAHAHGTEVMVSLDLSGESLHRRGYRTGTHPAPLKENVAAGMLLRCGWPAIAAAGGAFLDPLCGSGTLVIEAALIAADCAPGLSRPYYGFLGWRSHDAVLWERLLAEARERCRNAAPGAARLRGQDRDARGIRTARENAERAGIASWVEFATAPLAAARPGAAEIGLVCTNPPYGVRLEDQTAAREVHRELGVILREHFRGWQVGVLTGAPELGKELGLRAHRTHALWNGPIECRLLRIEVKAESLREPGHLGKGTAALKDNPGAVMFANRLAKNLKRLAAWAKREGISCYRLYDADMPEYAFAIDRYETVAGEAWLIVQEYEAPAEIEREAVRRRRGEALSQLTEVTGIDPERIRVRTRRRTKRGEQYNKLSKEEQFHVVSEGGLKFKVNFDDYLDTGLFLDHRLTRARLRSAARGTRFLNLFCYTGSATVYAAAGGAHSSTSVDLSRTYLDWASENLRLNALVGAAHQLVQADCRVWLEDAAAAGERYDLIFLDPPTFSNSKRMEGVLDIERDHPALISACKRLLEAGGLIVFSTNAQRFKLHESIGAAMQVRDISSATLPLDYERNPRIHRCFELRPLAGPALFT